MSLFFDSFWRECALQGFVGRTRGLRKKRVRGGCGGDFGLKLMSGLGLVKIFAVKIP